MVLTVVDDILIVLSTIFDAALDTEVVMSNNLVTILVRVILLVDIDSNDLDILFCRIFDIVVLEAITFLIIFSVDRAKDELLLTPINLNKPLNSSVVIVIDLNIIFDTSLSMPTLIELEEDTL